MHRGGRVMSQGDHSAARVILLSAIACPLNGVKLNWKGVK